MTASDAARRIGKLIALAADQPGTPEGQTAQETADRLMKEYGVTLDDIDSGTSSVVLSEPFDLPKSNWRRHLLSVVARHFGAELVFSGRKGFYVGFRVDIAIASHAVDQLLDRLDGAVLALKCRCDPTRTQLGQFRTGWVMGIQASLNAMKPRESAGPTTESGALVLVKSSRVKDAMNDLVTRRHVYPKVKISGALDLGFAVGRETRIRPGIGSSKQRMING